LIQVLFGHLLPKPTLQTCFFFVELVLMFIAATSYWLNYGRTNLREIQQLLTCHIFYTRVKYAAAEPKSGILQNNKIERLKL